MQINLFHDRKCSRYHSFWKRVHPSFFFCFARVLLMNDSVGGEATWGNDRRKKRPSYATELWCGHIARGKETSHHSEGAGKTAVWSEKKEFWHEIQQGKDRKSRLSRSRRHWQSCFGGFLPTGDRWVITKTKQYSSTQLTLKCSGAAFC